VLRIRSATRPARRCKRSRNSVRPGGRTPPAGSSWAAPLRAPCLARALAAVHHAPEEDWTALRPRGRAWHVAFGVQGRFRSRHGRGADAVCHPAANGPRGRSAPDDRRARRRPLRVRERGLVWRGVQAPPRGRLPAHAAGGGMPWSGSAHAAPRVDAADACLRTAPCFRSRSARRPLPR
jgi:hypothetical protein